MSTDGTQPPSIAPKKPLRAGSWTAEGASPRVVGTTPAFAAPAPVTDHPTPSTAGGSARTGSPATGIVGSGSVGNASPGAPVTSPRPVRGADVENDRLGRSSSATSTSASTTSGPRRVRLAVARVDPWSVMKLSFLLAVGAGIMMVVATAVVWYTLDGLHVFTKINDTINTLGGATIHFNLLNVVGFSRVISLATMIAVVDVVLLTALSTIGAFLYNIVAALVGGIHLTLTDD